MVTCAGARAVPDTDRRDLHPEYRDRHITDPANFQASDIALLCAKYRRQDWREWARANGMEIEGLRAFEFQSSIQTYQAAKSGMGVAMEQLPLLEEELAPGALVHPFEKPVATGSSFRVTWSG